MAAANQAQPTGPAPPPPAPPPPPQQAVQGPNWGGVPEMMQPPAPPQPPPAAPRWEPAVESWRPLVEQYGDWDVDKVMHALTYESHGNEQAVGDGGHAYGGFQSHYIKPGASREEQVADAYRLFKADLAAGGTGFGDWGEGRMYQGQPFGAFGRVPYGNGSSATGSALGRAAGSLAAPKLPTPQPPQQQAQQPPEMPAPDFFEYDDSPDRQEVILKLTETLPEEARREAIRHYEQMFADTAAPGDALGSMRRMLENYSVLAYNASQQTGEDQVSPSDRMRVAAEYARRKEHPPVKGGEGTWETVLLNSLIFTGLGAPLRGANVAAKFLGPGTLSTPRFAAANLAGDVAAEGARSGAREVGAPSIVETGAGFVGGSVGYGLAGGLRPPKMRMASVEEGWTDPTPLPGQADMFGNVVGEGEVARLDVPPQNTPPAMPLGGEGIQPDLLTGRTAQAAQPGFGALGEPEAPAPTARLYEASEVTPELRAQVEQGGRYMLSHDARVYDFAGTYTGSFEDVHNLGRIAREQGADILTDTTKADWPGYIAKQSALSFAPQRPRTQPAAPEMGATARSAEAVPAFTTSPAATPLPPIDGMQRDRRVIPASDITTRPDLFQARDIETGGAVGEARVQQLVDTWDEAKLTPPDVVPDPQNPGKFIVYSGHHRTEAVRRVKGDDAPIEVQVLHADINDATQLARARQLARAANFTTAQPNYREHVRAALQAQADGLSVEDAATELRVTASQVEAMNDASRVGAQAIDRVVTEPGLKPYIEEVGRGMRVYGLNQEDANGLFNRWANAKTRQRPTPTAARETIDTFGALLQQQEARKAQGALFGAEGFEGFRGGLLGLIDDNARIRTELQRQLSALSRARRGVQMLAGQQGAKPADLKAAQRLADLGTTEETRIRDMLARNEENLARAMRGEEPLPEPTPPQPPADEPPPPPGMPPTPPPQPIGNEPIDQLIAYVQAAGAVRPDLLVRRRAELSKRVAAAAQKLTEDGVPPSEAFGRSTQALKGQLADPSFTIPGNLDADAMHKAIIDTVASADLPYFTGLNADEGLTKLAAGQMPAPHEVEALGQVFGPRLQQAIEEMGDIFKVQRRVEQVLVNDPIRIEWPDGRPLTPEELADAMRANLPDTNPEHLTAVAQRMMDAGEVSLTVDNQGRKRVTFRKSEQDALQRAANEAMFERSGDVPEQFIPPTQPGDIDYQPSLAEGEGRVTLEPGEIEVTPRVRGPQLRQNMREEHQARVRAADEEARIANSPESEAQRREAERIRKARAAESQEARVRREQEVAESRRWLELDRIEREGPSAGYDPAAVAPEGSALRGQATQPFMPRADEPGDIVVPPQVRGPKSRETMLQGYRAKVDAADEEARRAATPEAEAQRRAAARRKEATEAETKQAREQRERELGEARLWLEVDRQATEGASPNLDPRAPQYQGERRTLANAPSYEGGARQKFDPQYGFAGREWDPAKESLTENIFTQLWSLTSFPKSMLSGMDRSAVLRQGGPLIRHGAQVREAFAKTLVIAEDAADAAKIKARTGFDVPTAEEVMRQIHTGPRAKQREIGGLFEEEWGPTAKLSARNEQFMSNLARKIPGAAMAERAFVVYLNKLRADVFDSIVDKWEREGRSFIPGSKKMIIEADLKALGTYINASTGRGDLGAFEGAALWLSRGFFSPRLFIARYQTIAQAFAPNTPWLVRKEMAKDLATYYGTGIALLTLADLSGLAEVELDPRSSDFGKMRIGDTRIDIWGGHQQMARYMSQLATGQTKSSTGDIYDIDRAQVLTRYLRSKLSPSAGFGVNLAFEEDMMGEDFDLLSWKTVEDTFVPLFAQDVKESLKENGLKGIAYAPLSFLGAGVQTYTTAAEERNREQDKEAMARHGVKFSDLPEKFPDKGFSLQEEIRGLPNVKSKADKARERSADTEYGKQREVDEGVNAVFAKRQEDAEAGFDAGTLSRPLPEIYSDINKERAGARLQREAQRDPNLPAGKYSGLLDGYFDKVVYDDGVVDWDATEVERERYLETLAPDDQARLGDFLGVTESRKSEKMQRYHTYLDEREAAGYYREGITPQELQALDRENPAQDVDNWYWKGGVNAPGAKTPVLQSPQAVEQALAMNLANRPVKMDGLARPINQTPQTVEAWQATQRKVDWYLNALKTDPAVVQEAERLAKARYGVALSALAPDVRAERMGTALGNVREAYRQQYPEVDALMNWWGVTTTLHTIRAGEEKKKLQQLYGVAPPAENFKTEWAANVKP